MAIADYITDQELLNYIAGNDLASDSNINQYVSKIMSTKTNGIEG